MAERGIIFSAPMVRALLDGQKTQTRRLLKKPVPPEDADRVHAWFAPAEVPAKGIPNQWAPSGLWAVQHIIGGEDGEPASGGYNRYCGPLPYRPGDRLYVRENFQLLSFGDYAPTKHWPADVRYAATDPLADSDKDVRGYPWRPCIHMPRWASRLTLLVTDVRVQRVQEITNEDCISEGIPIHPNENAPRVGPIMDDFARKAGLISHYGAQYRALWNSLHTKPGERWEDNPWIVAVTFDVRHGNIDRIEA